MTPASASVLRDLAERIRGLTAPSREVDRLIGETAGMPMTWSGDVVGLGYARYTGSLDAASAFCEAALPGEGIAVLRFPNGTWLAAVGGNGELPELPDIDPFPSAAIALLAATLLAMAGGEHG